MPPRNPFEDDKLNILIKDSICGTGINRHDLFRIVGCNNYQYLCDHFERFKIKLSNAIQIDVDILLNAWKQDEILKSRHRVNCSCCGRKFIPKSAENILCVSCKNIEDDEVYDVLL